MTDFFLSYNRADRSWAEWIAWQLEEANYTTALQEWDFRPGCNFVLEMQKASAGSDRTIAVLSPDYLGAQYTQPEWAAAFAKDPQGWDRKLVPIRVRDCVLQGLLAQITYIELVGLEEREAKQKLLLGVRPGRAKPAAPPAYPAHPTHLTPTKPPFPGHTDRVPPSDEEARSEKTQPLGSWMSRTQNKGGRESKLRKSAVPQSSWPTIAPYAILSLASFVCGLVLVGLLLWQGDKLTAWGLTGNFYYLILLPLGLTAAAFLFGAMRSYARYQGRQLGGALELGGPVVGFALVVIGGFALVKNPTTVPLTVYVHGEAGRHELVLRNFGHVMLDLGPDRRREPISDKGQAYFPAIPAGFRGQSIAVWLDADGYEMVNPDMQPRLDGDSLYLAVRKTAGRISGRVQDEDGRPVAGAVLSVAGTSTTTDSTGHFELTVPADRLQRELPLQTIAPGFEPSHSSLVPGGNEAVVMLKRSP